MTHRRIAGGIIAAVAAVILTGCGPASPSSPVDTPSTSALSPTAAPTTATTTPAPVTTSPTSTPATTTPAPPTTRAVHISPHTTRPAVQATHRVTPPPVRHTTTAPPARTAVCSIRSNAGNCYRAGQFCRKSDLGSTTTDADGRTIHCVMQSGRPHWHY